MPEEICGQCMCGALRFSVSGETFGVVSCHCKDCQRLHGNYNPMIVAPKDGLRFESEESLAWWTAPNGSERGFCTICSSAPFNRPKEGTKILISVGCFDNTEGLENVKNVITEEAGHYYLMPPATA